MFNNVEIEINSDCNRKCWYCPNYSHERKEKGEMDISIFLAIINQLSSIDYSDRITYHFYGEPLLCSKLDEYVEITKLKLPKAYPVLFTNGDYLDKVRLEKLLQAGIQFFIVTQQIGWKNNFFKTYQELSTDIKGKVFFRTYKDIDLNNRGGLISVDSLRTMDTNVPCYLPSSMIQITLKGNVLPCCDDYEEVNIMGNVCEKSLVDIWESQQFVDFRKALLLGKRELFTPCKNCNHTS